MIRSNINVQDFTEQAKAVGYGQRMLDLCLDKNNVAVQVFYAGTDDIPCDNCAKQFLKNDLIIAFQWNYTHLGCVRPFACAFCGKGRTTSSDDFTFVGDNIVCGACEASMKECLHCHKLTYPTQLKDGYCTGCMVACGRCGNKFPLPHMYMVRGGRMCKLCGGRDIWVKQHDFNPLSVLQFQGKPKNGIYYGVELEIEAASQAACVALAEELTKSFGRALVIKHDGSLSDNGKNGLELVTAPGDFDFQKQLWKDFFDKGYKFESFSSERCSTHVHISKQPLKPMQLARMAHFIYAPKNRDLVQLVGGRNLTTPWGNRYAKINQDITVKDLVEVYGSPSYFKRHYGVGDSSIVNSLVLPESQRTVHFKANLRNLVRYSALNLTNPNTAEMRIFCGTSKYETMMKNLEFCQSLIDFCAPVHVSISELSNPKSYFDFIALNRGTYPNLYRFLFDGSKKKNISEFVEASV